MKMFKPRTLALAVASAVTLGLASQASAAPLLTIDTSAITGAAGDPTYTGDFFTGSSTELLQTTSATTHSGEGWLFINSLTNGAVPVANFGATSTIPFNLYVTFSLTDTLASGTMNTAGSSYTLNSLDFTVWADPSKNNTYTNANIVGGVTTAPAVGNTGDDIVLAVGSLISGTAGFNTEGGVFLNWTNSFAVCDGAGTADLGGTQIAAAACAGNTGTLFFVDPKPFYDLAFTEFNNTSQGFVVNPLTDEVAINSASGGIDFNRVPEPGVLTLLGLGLAGIGATVARRRKVA